MGPVRNQNRLVVGIDKGTSLVKTAVFDENGHQIVSASRRIIAIHDERERHEEDPGETWKLTAETISECMHKLGDRVVDVAGVGVVGHMGGAWFIGENGKSVRNAISWPDARANGLVQSLESGPLHQEYLSLTETAALPGMTAFLLAHVAKHEPDVLSRTKVVLHAKDFVQFMLTGVAVSDPSDASFVPFDINALRRSDRVLELVGALEWKDKFPILVPSGDIVGSVTREAAHVTGLPLGTPVVAGLGDAPASMVGCGALDPGSSVSILGTSWLSANVVSDPHDGKSGVGWMYPMPNGLFAHFVANTSGASTLDWWLHHLAPEVIRGESRDFENLEREILAVPEASTKLTFLPYLSAAGVQAPFKDANLRGTLLGLETSTTRGEIFRAIFEGMAYSVRDCYSSFESTPSRLGLTGGGAQSSIWPGILSNIMAVPVELLSSGESAALGVALLAGTAVGVWPSLDSAVEATVHVAKRYEPDLELVKAHDNQFLRFKKAQKLAREFYDLSTEQQNERSL